VLLSINTEMSSKTIAIELSNSKAKLHGDYKSLNLLYEAFKIRHPQAFHMRKYMPRGWDGKIELITKSGYMPIGLLPALIKKLEELKMGCEIDDHRLKMDREPELVDALRGGLILRDYQRGSVESIINHTITDSTGDTFPFYRGILKEATNAGKTIIAASIFESFHQAPTIMVISGDELYKQARQELPEYIDPKLVGWIDPKSINLKPFVIAKVKTLANRLPILKKELLKYRVALIDECDLADNKTYKAIITSFINTPVIIGMSGTAAMGKLAKHIPKKMAIEGMFGPIIHETTNRELIDKGHSSEVIVKMVKGNRKLLDNLTYREEYDQCIVYNKERHQTIIDRLKYNCVKKGRIPALIICQRIDHVKELRKAIRRAFKGELVVVSATGKDKEKRKVVIEDFRAGKIDILITSMIINRGMNLKNMRFLMNAAGGESPERPIQILGRQMRKTEGVGTKYFEDIADEGKYLSRHSRRRELYYNDEKLTVLTIE
jgi:superfamily II DNA or RNA helicase